MVEGSKGEQGGKKHTSNPKQKKKTVQTLPNEDHAKAQKQIIPAENRKNPRKQTPPEKQTQALGVRTRQNPKKRARMKGSIQQREKTNNNSPETSKK